MAKGVVIFGVPRSGTTLLRRLVDAHPAFACPAETLTLSAAARFLAEEPIANGLDVGVLTGLASAGFSPEMVLERLRSFVFSFHREHAARQNKPRWAEKSAFDVFRLREIEALCGDEVQYVCIVRQALDVVTSLAEFIDVTERWQGALHDYVVRYPRPLEALAHAWDDGTRAILDLVERRPVDACLLRYEDLVARPGEVMQRVMNHLGETWPDGLESTALSGGTGLGMGDWKSFGKAAIDGESVGRHKRLSRLTIQELAPVVNATLERCGYPRLPEGPRPTRERALALAEAALKVQRLVRR